MAEIDQIVVGYRLLLWLTWWLCVLLVLLRLGSLALLVVLLTSEYWSDCKYLLGFFFGSSTIASILRSVQSYGLS